MFYGGQDGEKFVIVLEDNKDKATIANKLPEQFKGKIEFRKFEDGDEELQPIIDKEAE